MPVQQFTKTGSKSTKKVTLPKEVFGLEVTDHGLLKQVYLAAQANGRVGSSNTKTRGEIRGGGRKPWRQKGTGRARVGSIRSPIWRGGGIVFGPRLVKNYHKKVNKNAKRRALAQALSIKASSNSLVAVEAFPEYKKTKEMAGFLDKIAGDSHGTLIITADTNENLKRSCNNLPEVQLVTAAYLSVPRVLDADLVVIESDAVKKLETLLGGKV